MNGRFLMTASKLEKEIFFNCESKKIAGSS